MSRPIHTGKIRIGISGWRYAPWRKVFYPEDLVQAKELHFASRALPSIEINGSFYGLQRPTSYARWYEDTPQGFVFSAKAHRYITHILRLRDVEKPIANFLASGLFHLKEKLGPILWQFPPSFRFDPELFESFLKLLPHDSESALALAQKCDARVRDQAYLAIDENRPLLLETLKRVAPILMRDLRVRPRDGARLAERLDININAFVGRAARA